MSFQTEIRRIIRSGFVNFWRNGFVSFASVIIMSVTLLVIGSLVFMQAVLGYSVASIEDKVDVNIYFYPDVSDQEVFGVQDKLEALPEVFRADFVSSDEALEEFIERHEDDYLTLQALDELGENPFGATLNIRAVESEQYETIILFLESENVLGTSGETIIERINYYENQAVIERLGSLTGTIKSLGIAATLIFVVISILVTFNTIRLAIYASRKEITVMRMVGATNKYIQGPFITEGVINGIVAAITALIILYPVTFWVSKKTIAFFGGLNLFKYYLSNFPQMLVLLVVSGILIGALSSIFAVRRYLKK